MTTKCTTAIKRMSTTSTLMFVGLQKIGKRILRHLRKRERREPLIIEQITIPKEWACQDRAEIAAEAHSSLCIACIMATTQTIAEKTAHFS
jgi:hypothetical protein